MRNLAIVLWFLDWPLEVPLRPSATLLGLNRTPAIQAKQSTPTALEDRVFIRLEDSTRSMVRAISNSSAASARSLVVAPVRTLVIPLHRSPEDEQQLSPLSMDVSGGLVSHEVDVLSGSLTINQASIKRTLYMLGHHFPVTHTTFGSSVMATPLNTSTFLGRSGHSCCMS